ncbi:flavodoxin family protein [Actinoalloteichus spitiensis]|uniref:flavodoxin family protein n=1 Tax=Actinoalloteichus spitiensis TaxID=252394 RepID=UPI00036D3F2B|nr:NAD(P)H-dependent oxidoreductase [Actinoalloteichus spitiensis]
MVSVRAVVLSCTLKRSPAKSNTELLTSVVVDELRERDVDVEQIRVVDREVPRGVETDLGGADEWPEIHRRLLESEILIVATPTWLGQPSSVSRQVLERMDSMMSETDDAGLPVAYNRVAGVVVTGNEDGAHHVISETNGALIDVGYTVPGQSWTYWNMGPGPGPNYPDVDHGHEWAHRTGRMMASNLVAVARALQRSPIPVPPS